MRLVCNLTLLVCYFIVSYEAFPRNLKMPRAWLCQGYHLWHYASDSVVPVLKRQCAWDPFHFWYWPVFREWHSDTDFPHR